MPRRYNLREDTKAMGSAQIMIGLIHGALANLWLRWYFLRSDSSTEKPLPILVLVTYSYVAGFFFINSGSCSVIQKPRTTCKIIAAIVMNSISVGVTVVGIVLICQQISVFESEATTYTWQNMVGMMLLQYLLFSTVSELIIAIIIVHWFKVALSQEEHTEESSLESSFPETSAPLPLEVPPSESNPP